MGEIGSGLFDRKLIHSIRDRLGRGRSVALLFAHFGAGCATHEVRQRISRWEASIPKLFWRQRMGNDWFFVLELPAGTNHDKYTAAEQFQSKLLEELSTSDRLEDIPESRRYGHETHAHTEPAIYRTGLSLIQPDKKSCGDEKLFQAFMEAVGEALMNNSHAVAMAEHARTSSSFIQLPNRSFLPNEGEIHTIAPLVSPILTVPLYAPVSEASYIFNTNPEAQGIVIVKEGEPKGLLMREKLHQLLAGQYGLSLYWNRSVERIMDDQPLLVDEQTTIEQVSQLAMSRSHYRLYDMVVITRNGKLAGAASVRAILEGMTALRTEEARSASPLTGLPGNSGIQKELMGRIRAAKPFALIYVDLDYFKWFNDCFGFGLGDELIRYVADLLRDVASRDRHRSSPVFLGHVGGDDFVAMMEVKAAEETCKELIARFDSEVQRFYGGMDIKYVEDRSGNAIEQGGVSLSLSMLVWDGLASVTPQDISYRSAAIKKKAKAVKGSIYLIEHLKETQRREETVKA